MQAYQAYKSEKSEEKSDKLGQGYTFKDYYNWDDDKRWELIDGIPHAMAAPSNNHQRVLGRLYLIFGNYLRGKKCEVFLSPFDVRLNASDKDNTVVQPDLTIVCDPNKLKGHGCKGVPDMVIEIISKSSEKMDKVVKFKKYQEAGVKEYWILDNDRCIVDVFVLKKGNYFCKTYESNDKVVVGILPELEIDLMDVFVFL